MSIKRFQVLFFIIVLFSFHEISAQAVNTKVKDPGLNMKEVLVGRCNRTGLKEGEFGAYFNSQYELYQPSKSQTEKLKDKINLVDITVVFATWCSDSKIQVPRFFKVLDAAGYNEKRMSLIGVMRDKNALTTDIGYLKIKLVPTFIVSQNGKELGRIIETPKKSLEKDLWKIVNKAKFSKK